MTPPPSAAAAGSEMERRQASIVAADVAAYTAHMEADEEGTLHRLRTLRDGLILPAINGHHGRLVKQVGDGFLAEFGEVLDALDGAVTIQRHAIEPAQRPGDPTTLRLRIGLSVGEVLIENDDVYGETVNLAARLEQLAPPGGILVNQAVVDRAGSRAGVAFEDWGERKMKNVSRPVRVFAVAGLGDYAPPQTVESVPTGDDGERPSVAVLPFKNLTGRREDEAIADGVAEEIITALSKFRWVFVIARYSSFAYKGRALDVKQVATELGVRYVLEGSYNQVGDRVRVHAQLIDAATGRQIWAERYDHRMADLFGMLDALSAQVVQALEPEIVHSERERHRSASPEALSAWQLFVRAQDMVSRVSRHHHAEARALLQAAVERDPTSAQAHAGLAMTYMWDLLYGWSDDPQAGMQQALGEARRAIQLDAEDSWAYMVRGCCRMVLRQHEDAIADLRHAVSLDPNFSFAHAALAHAYAFSGDYGAALAEAAYAERLSPRDPMAAIWLTGRSYAYFALGRHAESLAAARASADLNPDFPSALRLIAANEAVLGRPEAARAAIDALLAALPGNTITATVAGLPIRDDDMRARYADALRQAGLPD